MDSHNLDKNDRAIQLFLNGQHKEMRDNLGKGNNLKKHSVSNVSMPDSIAIGYNNRPPTKMVKKNLSGQRRLAQIADQE